MIPKIFHFIYISKDGSTTPNFSWLQYISIKSAIVNNPNFAVRLTVTKDALPDSEWYGRILSEFPQIELNVIEYFDSYCGKKLNHFTHITDVIRLMELYNYGGVYLDLDTITIANLDPLIQRKKFVAAIEDDSWRMGNGVMISSVNNSFILECLDLYEYYRSTGRDEFYVEVSQELPYQLFNRKFKCLPGFELISADLILSPKTLCDFKGNQIYFKHFFEECDRFSLEGRYILHLWTELNGKYLDSIDLETIDTLRETTFIKLVKSYL